MNFNEYKPRKNESNTAANAILIAAVAAGCAIMYGALKLACFLDYCNQVGF